MIFLQCEYIHPYNTLNAVAKFGVVLSQAINDFLGLVDFL